MYLLLVLMKVKTKVTHVFVERIEMVKFRTTQNRRCLENSAKTAPASTANASDQVIVEKVNHLRLLLLSTEQTGITSKGVKTTISVPWFITKLWEFCTFALLRYWNIDILEVKKMRKIPLFRAKSLKFPFGFWIWASRFVYHAGNLRKISRRI